ncbi:MAG: ATP-binding protein [Gemmatimonadaceae bacterium]
MSLRRHIALPYVTGLLVISLSAGLAWSLQRREDGYVHGAVKVKARALATLTMTRLGERSKALSGLTTMSLHSAPARMLWDAEALRIIHSGDFRALWLVDSSGHVAASVPEERGSDRANEPRLASERAAVALAARTTGQVSTSAPIFTTSGVPIVMSAAPTAHGASAVVGESSIPVLLRNSLDDDDVGFSFALYVNGRELYARRQGPLMLEAAWGEDAAMGDPADGWRLRVWPTEAELAWRNSHLPQWMLFVGTLFALGLAGTMRLYQTADRRAHALARANDRLEDEIFERERAQEALERSEGQLRQSRKMEAVGRLAGGIAHDFNNLLTAINGYADFLLDDIDRSDPRRDDVREIKKAATRAGALTTQLLAFSRRQVRQPRSLDLNALLTDVVVTTGTESFAGPTARAGLVEGRYIRLRVRDTGIGMDAATKARIFEPFFTTKDSGKGTGLGLSTVYAIVENLRGTVDVDSIPGKGTTFTVYLPQHDEPADLMASGTLTTLAPRGDETVLLVEDEDAVRALGARILERT